jgi:hypothetical protein
VAHVNRAVIPNFDNARIRENCFIGISFRSGWLICADAKRKKTGDGRESKPFLLRVRERHFKICERRSLLGRM